jgi:hypothetical protein
MGGKILYSTKLANLGILSSELFTQRTVDEVLEKTEEYY